MDAKNGNEDSSERNELNVAVAGEEANHVVEDVSSRPEDVAQSTAIDVSQVAIGAIPSKEAQDDGVRPEGTSIKGLGQISATASGASNLSALRPELNENEHRSRPATAAKLMKMIDLLNTSIGKEDSTDKHQLNLNMLYALLLALIEKLDMKDTSVPIHGISLPTTDALLNELNKEQADPAAVTEMWNIIQLQKQTEANRDGINKLMEITDGILNRLTPLNQYINDVNGLGEKVDLLSRHALSALDLATAAKDATEAAKEEARHKDHDTAGKGSGSAEAHRRSRPHSRANSRAGSRGRRGESLAATADNSQDGSLGGGLGGGSDARRGGSEDNSIDDGSLLDRIEELEAQVKRLQKFRKAATFKIQDLPDHSGRMIKMTSDILGVSSTETSSINGEMKKKESVGKLMKMMQAMPDMSLKEMRGLAELLRRALTGTEWDKLKELITSINVEQGLAVTDEDLLIRLKALEDALGIDPNAENGAGIDEHPVMVKESEKSRDRGQNTQKAIRELQKDVNHLGEFVKAILDGGGAEAAEKACDEIRQLWQKSDKHASDIERSFAHLDGIEAKVKDVVMQLNGVARLAQSLKEDKADKKWVRTEMDEKADRAELALKIDAERYNKDMEEIDAVIAELEGQISEAMVKFYRELNALKIANSGKLDKDNFAELSKMLMHKSAHMDQMLTFVSEVFKGDKGADFLKNRIMRNNCCSCDRVVYTSSQPVEPSIPAGNPMAAAQSIAPAATFKKNQIRQGVNNSNFGGAANRNGNDQFSRAVAQRESLWRERSERVRQRRHELPEVVGRVRVRDLRDFNNEAYYRVTGPGQFVDTYAQEPRPVGGDYTTVRAEQRFPQSERPLPPLDANANNDISDPMNHGNGDSAVAIPMRLIQGQQAVDLVSQDNPHQTFAGCDSNKGFGQLKDGVARNPPSTPS